MSAVLLETSVDERATLEAAFALIGGDTSDSISSDSSTWLSEELVPAASERCKTMKGGQTAGSVAPDQVAMVAPPAAQAPVQRKRVGNRKEDLARLRADVKALQTRTDFLKRRCLASRFSSAGTELVAVATHPMAFRIATGSKRARHETASPLADSRLVGVWKDVSERQRHRRTASEMVNMRLRALVKGQQRTVNRLKAIVQRQATLQMRATAPLIMSTNKVAWDNFSPAEVAKLHEMWQGLEHFYFATDYAFQLNGLAAVEYSPVMSTQITPLSATTTLIEVTGNALLPLGFRDTAAILWKFVLNNCSNEDIERHQIGLKQCGIPSDGSSFVRTYSLDERIGKLQVTHHGCHANRNYLEQHRAVAIYSGVARVVQIQGKNIAGITTTDRGHIVVSDAPSASGPLCLCQASNEIVVKIDGARLDEKVHLKELTDFLVRMKSDIYDRIRECVENAALGRAPTRRIV